MRPEDEGQLYDSSDQDDQDDNALAAAVDVPIQSDTLLLIGTIAFFILAVLAFLASNFLLGGDEEVAVGETPTPTGSIETGSPGAGTPSMPTDGTSVAVLPSPTGNGAPPTPTATVSPYPEPAQTPQYPGPGGTPAQTPQYPGPGRTPVPPSYPAPAARTATAQAQAQPGRTPPPGASPGASPQASPGASPEPGETLLPGMSPEPGRTGTAQPGPGPGTTVPTFAPTRATLAPTATPTTFVETPTVVPTNTPLPPSPTSTLAPPTPVGIPTPTPALPPAAATSTPTIGPDEGIEEEPTVTPTPTPTPVPYDVLTGNVRWARSQSPVVLNRTAQVAPGSTLLIEPGTEVRLDWGASLVVAEGATLLAPGTETQPIRFVANTGRRWDGIYGRDGSVMVIEHAEIRQGGSGGTLLMSENGQLTVKKSRIEDNGGNILTVDSKVEMRDNIIAGNDMPYGGALNTTFTTGNVLTLHNNRIGGNRLSEGASVVDVKYTDTGGTLVMDIQGNLVTEDNQMEDFITGANLLISTSGRLEGTLACNSLIGGDTGLRLRTQTTQVPQPALNVFDNMMMNHTPQIIPEYENYGIGRGATSEVKLTMVNNWWGDASGPYEPTGNPKSGEDPSFRYGPEANPEGRGEAVGSNIFYRPWLTQPPSCAPWP